MTSVSHENMITFLFDHAEEIPQNGHMWDVLNDNDGDDPDVYYPLTEQHGIMREYLKTNLKFFLDDERNFHFDAEHFDEIRAIALLISCESDNGGGQCLVADAFGTGGDDSFDYHTSYIEDMVDLAVFYLKNK